MGRDIINPTAIADAKLLGIAVLVIITLMLVPVIVRWGDTIDPEDGRDD